MSRGSGHTRRAPRRRWSDLSQVERVGLYTRQSLYVVMGATNAFLLLSVLPADRGDAAEVWQLCLGGVAVTAAGLWTLRPLLDRLPGTGPLPRRRIALLLGLAAVYLAVAALAWSDDDVRGIALALVAVAVCLALGILPDNRIVLALVLAAAALGWLFQHDLVAPLVGAFVAAAFVVTSRASMWLFGIVRDLDDARNAQSELAVAEERLRFSRDVHDVLGRRLSTIAVQAELAATLAQRGDTRAPERMLEVREVAHQALREARELARGYRAIDFGKELEGAGSLLRSAGIDVRLAVEAMPHAWQEPAGWVVRESVTNVLRHSDATVVEITFSADDLRIDNDGARPAPEGDGAGLQGLRERLAPLGASLSTESLPDGRWSVVARLPGAGPLSNRAAREGAA